MMAARRLGGTPAPEITLKEKEIFYRHPPQKKIVYATVSAVMSNLKTSAVKKKFVSLDRQIGKIHEKSADTSFCFLNLLLQSTLKTLIQ